MSKDGCRKIAAMHVALNAGISVVSRLMIMMIFQSVTKAYMEKISEFPQQESNL